MSTAAPAPQLVSRFPSWVRGLWSPRPILLSSLAIAWLNFILTSRWAAVPGSLHGSRRPYYFAALLITTLLAARRAPASPARLPRLLPVVTLTAAALLLAFAFVSWFPPSTWTEIPFLDDWPPRFVSTMEGIALLRRGVLGGWQWAFLGGYHTVSDITQNLSVLAFVPVTFFGPTIGFHLLHAVLIAAIPLLVFVDLADEDREVALTAAALSCLLAGNFSYMLIRSGDTNSIAGVACTMLALVGSHMRRRGRRAGIPLLVGGLTLTAYSHAGFFVYCIVYLAIEAWYYRDTHGAIRSGGAAIVTALVASLPLTWELWRYPAYFESNNLGPQPPALDVAALARTIFYNVEILFRPGRWSNDYTGATAVLLPVILFAASARRSRAGFYAVAGIATVLMLRLNAPIFGYVFARPMHMYVALTAVPLAWFIVRKLGRTSLAVAVIALVALFIQITFSTVPHVSGIESFDRGLVRHVAGLGGNLVLVENSPHRNMNTTRGGVTEPTPFEAHFEAMLPEATGRRFYAGFWDGWQWCPWRVNTLAGGTFRGRAVADTAPDAFVAEMRRWGVKHAVVWSRGAHAYLDAHASFSPRWRHGRWTDYEMRDADVRSVAVSSGNGELTDLDPLGATVSLSGVAAGDVVVVRTNFYPAWNATSEGHTLALFPVGGQLAFRAPRSGSYLVSLEYPRRAWLIWISLAAGIAGLAMLTFVGGRRVRAS